MRQLDGLAFVERATSHMGALEACLKHLGIAVPPGWLFGSTGHAFILNIGSDLCGSGPHCWDWATVNRLGAKAIGYEAQQVYTNFHQPDREQKQQAAWDMVRRSTDAGHPCYGWHYDFMVICGYDEGGYILSGPNPNAPGDWRKFGMDAVGFMDIWAIRPGMRGDYTAAITNALAFAARFARLPERDGNSGLAGYERWISGMEAGTGDGFGGAYNAGIWAECRRFAVAFLREAGERRGGRYDKLFVPAIAQYATVSRCLDEVESLFPYRGIAREQLAANMADASQRTRAAKCLREALAAEEAGVACLEQIVAQIK